MTAKERDALLVRLDERVKTLFTNQSRTDENINKLVEGIEEDKRTRESNGFKKWNIISIWVSIGISIGLNFMF